MATGDISGRILIWHDFVNRVRPVKTVYHWHTLAVNSVCFSSEGLFILIFPFYYSIFNFCFPNHLGEYLYSGGSENVMVKWRLGMSRKQCLPRMGSSIKFIVNAPDNICVATSHFDNGSSYNLFQIRMMNIQMIFFPPLQLYVSLIRQAKSIELFLDWPNTNRFAVSNRLNQRKNRCYLLV